MYSLNEHTHECAHCYVKMYGFPEYYTHAFFIQGGTALKITPVFPLPDVGNKCFYTSLILTCSFGLCTHHNGKQCV